MKTGMQATGVHVHVRSTGEDFGLHQDCYDRLTADLPPEVTDPFTGDLVTIGPLFGSSWTCGWTDCEH